MPSFPVFLALGANLGAREATRAAALEALPGRGVRVTRRSGLYLTEPVGGPPQDCYVNQVVRGETALDPDTLLDLRAHSLRKDFRDPENVGVKMHGWGFHAAADGGSTRYLAPPTTVA